MQIGLLQVGALKTLGILLSSRKLLEFLLVPKSPTKDRGLLQNKDKKVGLFIVLLHYVVFSNTVC